jgi:hypothetical protein
VILNLLIISVVSCSNTEKSNSSIKPIDSIRLTINDHIPQLKKCYQKNLDGSGKRTSGVVDFSFVIDKSGKTKNIDISRRNGNISSRTQKCLAKIISGVQFPKPKNEGEIIVRQPVNFYLRN